MQDEHADACQCRVCLGEWPEPKPYLRLVVDNPMPMPRVLRAFGARLEAIYRPVTEASIDIDRCLARLKALGV